MIDIQGLYFRYDTKQTVLEDLRLKLTPGHIYGLLGRNGAGKSSLLHNICGLLFPGKGVCNVLGQKPSRRDPSFLQQIFLLPEEFNLPNVSVNEYLDVFAPFYPQFDYSLFGGYLTEFDIPVKNTLQRMSYGQKKKVLISFALATRVKVLLMDEPTNGLDIPSKRQFRKIMAGALQDDQIIIISTHQVKDLDNLIDRVLILEDKKIIVHESVEQITGKLVFKHVISQDEIKDVVYSEGALKGHAVVALNHHSEHSKLDMEIFFNAVLSEKKHLLPLLNN